MNFGRPSDSSPCLFKVSGFLIPPDLHLGQAVALESFRFGLTELHAELPVYWQHCHVNPTINRFEVGKFEV